jgi:toxin ParE1/3/4
VACRLSKRAISDLDAIWVHLFTETGNEEIADRQIDSITSRFYLLADHPRIGRARDDDLGRGRRSFPVGDYVIVYRIIGADVQVLRVVHGRRDLPALFGQ